MRILSALCLLMMVGCTTVETVRPHTFARPSELVETIPLPPHPKDEDLGLFPGGEQDLEPIGKGDPSPMDGIVSSERRAARDGVYRDRYGELRTRFEADQALWHMQRKLYETQLDLADKAIRAAQPTWLEQNAMQIGLGSGLVVGVGVTVLIAFAVSSATK